MQQLHLYGVRPTSITAEQLALLAAATSLRCLALSFGVQEAARADREAAWRREVDRLKVRCAAASRPVYLLLLRWARFSTSATFLWMT